MITLEHCANTRQTWAKCGCCLLESCFCLFRLTLFRAEHTVVGEFSPSIRSCLSLTVIKLSKSVILPFWAYRICLKFKMTLVLSRCRKIFLRYMPTYGIKDFLFKVPFHLFCLTSYPDFTHLFLMCGLEKMRYIIHVHVNTLVCSVFLPLSVWRPKSTWITFIVGYFT